MTGGRPTTIAFVALLAAAACSGRPVPRDVLLVTVDTLRPDLLGAYGFEPSVSPSFDALARRGVVFERAVAASPRTAPSHASIMASRWVREHSIGWHNGDTRLEGALTLAEVFRRHGYATAAFVGNVVLRRRSGLDAGFELYDDDLPDAEANRPIAFERIAEKTTKRALAWLAAERSRPVFLWLHYQDPHGPYTPPPPYDRTSVPHAEDAVLPARDDNRGRHGIPAYQVLGELRRVRDYVGRYAGEIAYFDHWLGRFLDRFEAASRQPVVLFTADHGESLGERDLYFSHGSRTTPDQVWVPLVVVAPDLEPARRWELVHHVDVMPTLLDLAGLPLPEDLRGVSLAGLPAQPDVWSERLLFSDAGRETSAYRGNHLFRARTTRPDGPWDAVPLERLGWRGAEVRPRPRGAAPDVRAQLRAYATTSTPLVRAGPASPETIERLRALGYLPPAEEAPPR